MGKKKFLLWSTAIALFISAAGAAPASASDKTISSVPLRIDSDLEIGDRIGDIDIEIADDVFGSVSGAVQVSTSSSKFAITDAQWVTSSSKTVSVGFQPEMKVWLTPCSDYGNDYAFKGTYRASNVSIRNGSFVSATKSGGDLIVRLKMNPIKGTFEAPYNAYWKDNAKGTARWEAPDSGDTGRYQVELYRGSSCVHSVETTGHTYNFYPYMTAAGTYRFRVRTIAKSTAQENYGKSSYWTESDEIYLAKEDVSDGSGRSDSIISGGPGSGIPSGNTRVGWQAINGHWYYYFPDGSYRRDGWQKVDNKWYLFDSEGRMLTGWQTLNNQTYYMLSSGEMYTGWTQWNQRWYYLNPTQDAYLGCLVKSHWLNLDGKTYYLDRNGAMTEGWAQIDGKYYYFYPGSGQKAVNTWISTFYVDENGVWNP